MNNMSEQLWYTWSTWGFSGGNGFQIRAVSPGFLDARGSVSTHTGQLQTLMKHLNYTLPQDVINKNDVVPEKTPLCLAFICAGQEMILLHKRYTGLDGARRPGAFFSHLLTKLPEFASARPEGYVEFTAREAIDLWKSPFWKTSENTLVRGDTKLLPVVLDEQYVAPRETRCEPAHNGPLGVAHVASVNPQHLLFVIQAFLSLEKNQQLFIAADPDTVAIFIWALTHCLPRTLSIMHDLTFSTYERIDGEKSAAAQRLGDNKSQPTIVGTSWLYEPRDLPVAYYLKNNPYGIAFNCYTNNPTPITPKNDVMRFAQFAVECFLGHNGHNVAELDDLWQKAERGNITELSEFLSLYITYQENLTREEIIELLRSLNRKIALRQRGEPVQVDPETLQRENVQRSIFHWTALDPPWWQTQCEVELAQLRKFVDGNIALKSGPSQGMSVIVDGVSEALQAIAERALRRLLDAIRSNTGSQTTLWTGVVTNSVPLHSEVQLWVSLFQSFSSRDLDTPAYSAWWNYTGKNIFDTLRQLAGQRQTNVLTTNLSSFGVIIADKVRVMLQGSDQNALIFWLEVMKTVATPTAEPEVWANFLNTINFTGNFQFYQLWWLKTGKTAVAECQNLVNKLVYIDLKRSLNSFAKNAVNKLVEAVTNNQEQAASLWSEMLFAAEPFSSTSVTLKSIDYDIWADLFQKLYPSLFQPAYYSWWQRQGREAVRQLHLFVDVQPQDKIAKMLHDFVTPIGETLLNVLQTNDEAHYGFLSDVLATVAPYQKMPYIWYHLFLSLDHYTPIYRKWWNLQGKGAIVALRHLTDTLTQQNQYNRTIEPLDLSVPAIHIADKLTEVIKASNPQKMTPEQEEAFLFWKELIATIAPYSSHTVNEASGVWMKLLYDLWPFIYKQPFALWWLQQGREAVSALSKQADTFPASDIAQDLKAFVQTCVLPEVDKHIKSSNTGRTISGSLPNEVPDEILLDLLAVVVPRALAHDIWLCSPQDLFTRLTLSLHTNVYTLYSWELRQTLLKTWASLELLRTSESMQPWLEIKWSEIGMLNKLNKLLPPEWYIIALKRLLGRPNDIAPSELISLVTSDNTQFEKALSQSIAMPDMAEISVSFFAILARNFYPRKVRLLGILLRAGIHLPDYLIQKLLNDANLQSEEVADLLENHCQEILANYKLPLALQAYVTEYLKGFDVQRLGLSSTTKFLDLLQKRMKQKKLDLNLPEELSAYIRGWNSLSQLVTEPSMSSKWLKDASGKVRAMSNLQLGTRSALSTHLLPILINEVNTESDLVRVTDNLGIAFMGEQKDKDALEPGLALLRTMVTQVSERYRNSHSLGRLIPYITFTLNNSHVLLSPKKEEFVDSVLHLLLATVENDTLIRINQAASFWPDSTATEWHAYRNREEMAHRENEDILAPKQSRQGSGPSTSTYISEPQSVGISQETAENTQQTPIARVENRDITWEQLQHLLYLKDAYLAYRINYLAMDKRYEEAETVKKRYSSGMQRAVLAALDDLIDDVFIDMQLELEGKDGHLKPEEFYVIDDVLLRFKQHMGMRYEELLKKVPLTEQHVIDVLKIFRKRELFVFYLAGEGDWQSKKRALKVLQEWLNWQRSARKDAIRVNYDQLGLPLYLRIWFRIWPF
jgi:GTPase-associated protein 1, N-terminal domain type 2